MSAAVRRPRNRPSVCPTLGAGEPSRATTRIVSSPAMVPMTSEQTRPVDRRGEELRRAGRGAQHGEVPGRLVATAAGRRAAWPAWTCRRPSAAARRPPGSGRRWRPVDAAQFDRPSSSRSRDRVAWVTEKPLVGQQCRQLALRAHGEVPDQLGDPAVPGGLRRQRGSAVTVAPPRGSAVAGTIPDCSKKEGQQRLLRVQPVLRLVPDRRGRPVDARRR